MTADVGGVRRPPPLWGVIDEARLLGSGGGTPRAVARHSVRPGTVARGEPGSGVLGSPGGFICAPLRGRPPSAAPPGAPPPPALIPRLLGARARSGVCHLARSWGVPSGRGSLPPAPGSSGGKVAGGALPGGGAAAKPPFLPPSPGRLFAGFFWFAGYLAPGSARREALTRTVDRKGHRTSRRQNGRKERGVDRNQRPTVWLIKGV